MVVTVYLHRRIYSGIKRVAKYYIKFLATERERERERCIIYPHSIDKQTSISISISISILTYIYIIIYLYTITYTYFCMPGTQESGGSCRRGLPDSFQARAQGGDDGGPGP